MTAATAAAARAAMAAMVKSAVARPWKAPQISRTRADPARISSGRARAAALCKVIGLPPRRRAIDADQMLHRGVGQLEDHAGMQAQDEGGRDQGREDDH